MKKQWFALAVLTAALAGCSLAPHYEQPAAPVAVNWPIPEGTTAAVPAAADAAEAPAAAGIGWRQFFGDARLRQLITMALENNRDLRVAVLNIEAARAQYRIQRSELAPSVGVGATGTRQRTPAELNGTDSAIIGTQYQVGVSMPSFEIDFFGRVRSLSDAALAQYLATEETRRNVQIVLISQVAEAWLNLTAGDAQLALVRQTLASREQSFDLVQRRYDGGVASELDLNQAQSLLDSARSDLQAFTRTRAQALNALVLLTGLPAMPADLATAPEFGAQNILADIPTGVPSTVLLARPDVLGAEQQLRAANANIGAARAAFFPSISLTGMFGTASTQLGNLFGGGSLAWSFAPQITLPLFTGGSLQSQLDLAEVRKNIAVAQYEQAIQQGFREVADALAGRATYAQQIDAQRRLVASAQRSLDLSNRRYESGIDSFLQVQDAERTLFSAQQQLVQTRLAELVNRVALYKALGGGWVENTGQVPGGAVTTQN